MREIIFRGKRIDNGKWVYGDLAHFPDKINIDPHEHGQPWRGYAVIPETVGQYTGLTDKNGKRIFEGDMVAFREFKTVYKGKVVFNEKTCGFEIWFSTAVGSYGEKATHTVNFANIDYIEIIGNIHDNSKLIKEAKEDGN